MPMPKKRKDPEPRGPGRNPGPRGRKAPSVLVRFSDEEYARLDRRRGAVSRPDWVRAAWALAERLVESGSVPAQDWRALAKEKSTG